MPVIPVVVAIAMAARCTPATGDAAAVLRRAQAVTGLGAVRDKVLLIDGNDIVSQNYQSERWYPPFLSNVEPLRYWYSPSTTAERVSAGMSMAGYHGVGGTILSTERAAYVVRDTLLVPSAAAHTSSYVTRPLNVWAVLDDWMAGGNVLVSQRCVYRDYPRLVLTRVGLRGPERLFIDEKSGFPVKMERTEPHYLWRRSTVEYVYSTWQRLGEAAIPGVSFRVVDGVTDIERNIGTMELLPRDSAPSVVVPASTTTMPMQMPAFLQPLTPDTIRVGANAYLLRNVGYTEMVMLARDTVFVFDATQGDDRARADSVWIAALFPGKHATVLVVTDLAWPHIAGVPFWVARGVPVYGPRGARSLLASVIARRLPKDRAARFRFTPVIDSLRLANGDVVLFPIDGVASEVAIAAFDQPDATLWASDYIQDATAPSMYLDEVCRAVTRVRRVPERVAAQHLALTEWDALKRLTHCAP